MQKAIRHILATIAYRLNKTITDVDFAFGDFEGGNNVKTPTTILNHINQILFFAKEVFGDEAPSKIELMSFSDEIARFHKIINALDLLVCDVIIRDLPYYKLIQGPLADILTHVGQLAMLRRLYGSPIIGEDFMEADIQSGRF